MLKKIKKIAIFLFFIIPSAAYADSISTAISIVEEFEKESSALVAGINGKEAAMLRKTFPEERDKAVSELKSIGWTENPGDRRFHLTFKVVDSYTAGLISSVKSLDKKLPPSDKPRIDGAVKRLRELKEKKLAELRESRKAEPEGKKEVQKPVPLIDRSPYGTPPGEPPGIWWR